MKSVTARCIFCGAGITPVKLHGENWEWGCLVGAVMNLCVFCGSQVKERGKDDVIFFINWECPACNSRAWFDKILERENLIYRKGSHGKFFSVPEGCLFVVASEEL